MSLRPTPIGKGVVRQPLEQRGDARLNEAIARLDAAPAETFELHGTSAFSVRNTLRVKLQIAERGGLRHIEGGDELLHGLGGLGDEPVSLVSLDTWERVSWIIYFSVSDHTLAGALRIAKLDGLIWYLEIFDRETELLAKLVALPELSDHEVITELCLDPQLPLGDVYPLAEANRPWIEALIGEPAGSDLAYLKLSKMDAPTD